MIKNMNHFRIESDDPFRLKKHFKNHGDALLTPHDLFRIAKYLGKTPADVIEAHCDTYLGPDSRLLLVMSGTESAGDVLTQADCDTPAEDSFHTEWTAFIAESVPILQDLERVMPKHIWMGVQGVLGSLLYVYYNTAEEFLPQFLYNLAEGRRLLNLLQAPLINGGNPYV